MKNVGFIGLGNMGRGMSKNLSLSNLNVFGYDLDEKTFDLIQNSKVIKANSLISIVENCEIIITMLPDGNAVKEVWEELISHNKKKSVFIDCSTIDVETSTFIQDLAHKNNIKTLDAPVSGGVMGANNGSLTFMVGGNQNTYDEMSFLFNIMGDKSILCGSYGAGQSAKICNNLLLASTMIAVGESFDLAKTLNVDLNKMFEVISTSSGSCWAVNNYCPYPKIGPKTPADNMFSGGFSSRLMLKDLTLALRAAQRKELKLQYGENTLKKFQKLIEEKKGHLDFSNIVNN